MHRFTDENLYLWHFSGKILVHCPKCHSKAQVQHHFKGCDYKVDILCNQCDYYAIHNTTYYSLEFSRNCPQCGKSIEFKIDKVSPKNKKHSMKITCPHCQFTESYKPQYVEHTIMEGNIEKGSDQHFNADLWLQKSFRGHLFWALNYAHLDYLKTYIKAQIRERNNMPRSTMLTKLPKFIKSSKNRDDLLNIIEQLNNK